MNASDRPAISALEIAVAIVNDRGRLLIGLRPADAPLAGYWEFPGGKVEPGERAENAAVRECLEETGLFVQVVGEYPDASHRYGRGDVHLRFFACSPVEQRIPLPDRFRWVPINELTVFQFPPANAAIIALLAGGTGPVGGMPRYD